MVGLAGCAHDVPGPTVTETATRVVTVTPSPSVVTVTEQPPVACKLAFADVIKLELKVGKAEGQEAKLRDVLSDYKIDLAAGLHLDAAKVEQTYYHLHDKLGDTMTDLQDGIELLVDDIKECNNA